MKENLLLLVFFPFLLVAANGAILPEQEYGEWNFSAGFNPDDELAAELSSDPDTLMRTYDTSNFTVDGGILICTQTGPTDYLHVDVDDLEANGGGGYVNEYTLIFDLKKTDSDWLPLYNTGYDNYNEAELWVNSEGAVGSGTYSEPGVVPQDVWVRLAVKRYHDGANWVRNIYVNGATVLEGLGAEGVDGQNSLYSNSDYDDGQFTIFSDNDSVVYGGYELDNFAFIAEALSDELIAQLGFYWSGGILSSDDIPSTPVPANNANYVFVSTDLSWTGPTAYPAISYDLYYGTDLNFTTDTTVVTGLTDTIYDPPDFNFYTKYYWRVDSYDAATKYEGIVWSFTTDGKTDSPDPADGAIQVGQDSALNWRAVNVDGVTYDVYFVQSHDVNDVPEFVGNFSTNSFTPGVLMDPNSAYTWRVDTVCDDANTIEGDVWTFRTGGIAVEPYPADGQSYAPTDVTLSWTGDREGDTYVDGYDLYFGGDPVVEVAGTSYKVPYELAEDTTYTWRVDTKHDGVVITTGETWEFATGRLMGYWTLDTIDCIDEVAGNNGIILEGGTGKKEDPVIVPGPKGNAAYFNGTHFFKIVSDPNNWADSYKTLTVAAWIKWNPEDGNVAKGIVSKSADTWPSTGWVFGTYEHWSRVTFNLGGLDSQFWNPVSIVYNLADDVWHHIVYCWDGQERYAYLDGERTYVQTDRWGSWLDSYGSWAPDYVATEISPSSAPIGIGGSIDDAGLWASGFAGHIDDVRIYCRPLTPAQIQGIYTESKLASQPIPEDGESMVAWDTLLRWTPGSDDVASQNIRIGKEEDLSGAVEVTGLTADAGSCDITAELGANLELGTRYYWQVNTVTSSSEVFEGTIWWFAIRDLKPDIDTDLDVDEEDLGQMAGQWLDDSRSEVAENFVWWDHEDWTTEGGDPNLQEYFESFGPPIYGYSTITLNTSAEPDPNSTHDPGDQTVVYWFDMNDGGPYELEVSGSDAGFDFGFPLPEAQNHADFTPFDTLSIWMRKVDGDCTGSWYFWIGDQGGVLGGPVSWWGDPWVFCYLGDMPSEFTEYEVNISNSGLSDVVGFSFGSWSGSGGSATIEISDFVLKSSSTGEEVCWIGEDGVWTSGDINKDCDVNILDFAMMAEAWLLDAG